MPEYTSFAKIPIPLWEEADQVPPDLKRAFKVVDPLLVLQCTDEADLKATYQDVPPGTIISGTEQDAIWRKNVDGTFSVLWSRGVWSYPTLQNGWTFATHRVGCIRIGNIVYWQGDLSAPPGYTPNAWSLVCWVPASCEPFGGEQRFAVSGVRVYAGLRIKGGQLQAWVGGFGEASSPQATINVPSPYVGV